MFWFLISTILQTLTGFLLKYWTTTWPASPGALFTTPSCEPVNADPKTAHGKQQESRSRWVQGTFFTLKTLEHVNFFQSTVMEMHWTQCEVFFLMSLNPEFLITTAFCFDHNFLKKEYNAEICHGSQLNCAVTAKDSGALDFPSLRHQISAKNSVPLDFRSCRHQISAEDSGPLELPSRGNQISAENSGPHELPS